jgi:cysteine-S-conjugate beta-lyase
VSEDEAVAPDPATLLTEAGRRKEWTFGVVNPPVFHASTCVFESLDALEGAVRNPDAGLYYGRRGTPTLWALEEALTQLEPGAAGTKLYPSGVAAIAAALMSVLKAGDHLLIVDCVYEPTRALADTLLARLGVETTYFDPAIGAGVVDLMRENTRAVFLESPGSLSFEVQDIPAIARAAHAMGAYVLLDNTWATPLFFNAMAHGVDISIQSLTKYVIGHSDAMAGAATANARAWPLLKQLDQTMCSWRCGACARSKSG